MLTGILILICINAMLFGAEEVIDMGARRELRTRLERI